MFNRNLVAAARRVSSSMRGRAIANAKKELDTSGVKKADIERDKLNLELEKFTFEKEQKFQLERDKLDLEKRYKYFSIKYPARVSAISRVQSAKIRSGAAVFSTLAIFFSTLLYFKTWEEDLREKEKKIQTETEGLEASIEFSEKVIDRVLLLHSSHEIVEMQLQRAELFIQDLCKGDEACFSAYSKAKKDVVTDSEDLIQKEVEQLSAALRGNVALFRPKSNPSNADIAPKNGYDGRQYR